MHDPNSPHHQFDPSSVGWLHRRSKEGGQILSADVMRIIEANHHLVPDDILREHVVLGLQMKLKAKRGRKRTTARMLKELYIAAAYSHRLAWLQDRAAKRKKRGVKNYAVHFAPAELACELTGREFHMAPETVRNLVSSLNNSR
ncbi:hypothetical protein [Parasphingorhabdus sp.]|uniref:hypothetical protein n=1 Tax=Parasphingorhabdus sp. TaxID=2709688 RepID=UPI003C71F071